MEEIVDLADEGEELGREMGVSEWLSWVVILSSVVLIVALPLLLRERLAAVAEAQAYEKPDVAMLMAGRYAVGTEHLFKGIRGGAAPKSATKINTDMTQSIDQEARNGPDKLRAAIVRAELEGGEAGLKAVNDVAAAYPKEADDAAILRKIYGGGGDFPDDATWKSFHERNGWFADLAASFGKPDSDSLRAATLRGGIITLVGTLVLLLFAVGMATIGVVLLIVAGVYFFKGKLPPKFPRTLGAVGDKRLFVQCFAIYLGGALVLGAVIKYVLMLGGIWGSLALPAAFAAALFWPKWRGMTWREWRMNVGLHSGAGVIRELFSGAVGYVAGLPIFGAGIAATIIITKLSGANPTHPITREISADPWTLAGLFVLASVWAPITEELMFRGSLFVHLEAALRVVDIGVGGVGDFRDHSSTGAGGVAGAGEPGVCAGGDTGMAREHFGLHDGACDQQYVCDHRDGGVDFLVEAGAVAGMVAGSVVGSTIGGGLTFTRDLVWAS